MILAIIGAALVGATLGLLGSGGSILTVPILVYLVKHSEKAAIAESLAIVGAIALVGAARQWRAGKVDARLWLWVGLPGIPGAYVGAMLSKHVSGALQLGVLGLLMLAAAVLMVRKKPAAREGESARRHAGALGLIGVSVGLITGFVGVGGGFLIVPALVLLAGASMPVAVGTSLAIITLNAGIGFVKSQSLLESLGMRVDWGTIGLFAGVGIVGSLVGQSVGKRIDQATLKKVFAVFLVVMAGYILWREGPRALGGERAPAPAPATLEGSGGVGGASAAQ